MEKKRRLRLTAKQLFNRAIKDGSLVRPDRCAECGNSERTVEGHHPDYEKPLDVVWLCRGCHVQRHRKKPPLGPREKYPMDTAYLERERLKNGLTREALSGQVGISGPAYSGILKRKSAKPSTIKKMIQVLSLDPDKLIPDPKEAD